MLNRLNTEDGTNFEFTNHMVKMTKPNYYLKNLEIEDTKDSVQIKRLMHQAEKAREADNIRRNLKLRADPEPRKVKKEIHPKI